MTLYRDSYAVINLKNMIYNIDQVHAMTKKPLMAVIKADGYGCGYKEVAKCLNIHPHVTMFAVATLKEAIDLRQFGIKKDILILGAIARKREDIELAIEYDISLTVFSMEYLTLLASFIASKPLKVHIKVDTGMNRIGFKTRDELESAISLMKNSYFDIGGIFTHFATADGNDETYHQQLEHFYTMIEGYSFPYVHCCNSAAMMYHHEQKSNLGRIGIAMYGCDPAGNESPILKQVMSLYTKVVMVKKISANEQVGYGLTYTAKKEEYIATLPIGYADGVIRKNQGRNVYINGQLYPIVGRICMDQMMVKVDNKVQVDDIVEIFGEHITLATMAKELETIPYEIMCLITKRVECIYEK